jgi:hypothetical protein
VEPDSGRLITHEGHTHEGGACTTQCLEIPPPDPETRLLEQFRRMPVMIEFFDADQQPCGGAIHSSSDPGVLGIVPERARFWRPAR